MSDDKDQRRSDLEQFGDRLAQARGEASARDNPPRKEGSSAGDGMRVAIEFVVSVLVGAGLGYTIGAFFEAPVIGLLIGLPFGFAAGLRTVYRGLMAQGREASAEERNERGGNV